MLQRIELPTGVSMVADVVGSGPDVVLLHGIPGVGAVWEGVRDRLAASHRVITPDLVGFGRSTRTEDVAALWADSQSLALMSLLDRLDASRVVVVGHDFGGPVAAHVIARAPDRVAGLVLAATNAFGDTPVPFPLSAIFCPGVGRLVSRLLFSAPSLRMMVRYGSGRGGAPTDPCRSVGDRAQAAAIRALFDTALRELPARYAPVAASLGRLRVPSHVIWGDCDPFFPVPQASRTASLIPGASLTILPGAGHFLPEERPAELADLIAQLVARCGGRLRSKVQ